MSYEIPKVVNKKTGKEVSDKEVVDLLGQPDEKKVVYQDLEFTMFLDRLGIRADASIKYDALKGTVAARVTGGRNKEALKAAQKNPKDFLSKRRAGHEEFDSLASEGKISEAFIKAEETAAEVSEDEELTAEQMIAISESMPQVYETQAKLLAPAIIAHNFPFEPTATNLLAKGQLATEIVKELVRWYDPTPKSSEEVTEKTPNPSSVNTASTSLQTAEEADLSPDSFSITSPENTVLEVLAP